VSRTSPRRTKRGTLRIPGHEVADARLKAGMTQEELAEELGLHRVTISRLEHQTWPIQKHMLIAIKAVCWQWDQDHDDQ
jgi:DNA-binding XRE family transcriptional regulator